MAPHIHPKKRKQYKKPTKKHTKIHWQPHFTQPQHDVWYGRRHTNSAKRSKTRTQNGDTTQSRNTGQHGQHLPHVKSVPGWWSGHVTHTERTQLTWLIKKGTKRGAGGELSGEEWVVPTWVSKRYAGDGAQIDALSICCPMQLGFEKSRKEGRVTEQLHGTSSHTDTLTHTVQHIPVLQ